MKKAFLAAGLLLSTFANAQLVNNGANITVQSGGTIFCAGSFTNTSGTVTNDGRIEVQGNFANSGTYTSTANDDSLILSGSGNATLNSGGAIFRYLTINKATNSDLVTLTGSITVGNKLDYLSGVLLTDYPANPSYSVIAPASAVFAFSPGREIIGNVKRTGWSNGSMLLFNGANMQVTTNGGTAPSDVMVTMLPQAYGGDPSQAEREVKRKFLFAVTGGSGYTADVRFPYSNVAAELNTNVEGNLVPWTLAGGLEWNARLSPLARDVANKWVNTTGIAAASLAQEWKLADPRYTFSVTAFLKGGWNNPTGLMRTTINTNGLLPLSQPYNTAPYNYAGTETVGAIPNSNIVDWVLVELRKPLSGLPDDALATTAIGQKAGFILDNGSIVDLDGTSPLAFDITRQGAGNFIVLRHRNHLSVMSKSKASNPTGNFLNDFSDYANNYEKAGVTSPAASMLASSGAGLNKYGLWPGDVNRSGSVTSSDVTPINVAIAGPASGNTNTYNLRDTNLDRNITAADVSVTNSSIASFAVTSTGKANTTKKESHVPGEVKQ